jgi:AraC-like DNA-binding protein
MVFKSVDWFKLAGYYSENFEVYDMVPHSHIRTEIMYCKSGECSISYDSADHKAEKVIHLSQGDFVIVNPETPHKLSKDKGGLAFVYNLEFIYIHPTYGTIFSINSFLKDCKSFMNMLKEPLIKLNDNGHIYHLIEMIQSTSEDLGLDNSNTYLDTLIYALFYNIYHCYEKNLYVNIGYKYLKEAIKYIENNYSLDINISDIAKEVGISQSYLRKLFNQILNTNIINFINTHRIEKSKSLLHNSTISIEKISLLVGFTSRQNYTKTFKRLVGKEPTQFRKDLETFKMYKYIQGVGTFNTIHIKSDQDQSKPEYEGVSKIYYPEK